MVRYEVDIDPKEDLIHVASLYFESLDQMLDTIKMDQSTYYGHLRDDIELMDLDNARSLCDIAYSSPPFRFKDYKDHIEVPEEEAWGEGRVKLDPEFRKFLFGRRMFDPLNEELIENISGFDRASISNYRNEDRWIHEEGYRKLFNYFKHEFNETPTISIDIYEKHSEDILFEDLNLKQFVNYWRGEKPPRNSSKSREALDVAKRTRKTFDALLDEKQEERSEHEYMDVRDRIVEKNMTGEKEIIADNFEEESKLYELTHKDIIEHLEDNRYWIKI